MMGRFAALVLALALSTAAKSECTGGVVVPPTGEAISRTAVAPPFLYFALGASLSDYFGQGTASIWRLDTRDGTASKLWAVDQPVVAIGADSKFVFYTTPRGLWAAPLEGGSATLLATVPFGLVWFDGLVSDGEYVYWAVYRDYFAITDEIWRVPVKGGAVEVLATSLLRPSSLVPSGQRLFFDDSGFLCSIAKNGGDYRNAFTGTISAVSASDDGSVWFVSPAIVRREEPGGYSAIVYDVSVWRAAPPSYQPHIVSSSMTRAAVMEGTLYTPLVARTIRGVSRAYITIGGNQYFLLPFSTTSSYAGATPRELDSTPLRRLIAAEPPAVYVAETVADRWGQKDEQIVRLCEPVGERHRAVP